MTKNYPESRDGTNADGYPPMMPGYLSTRVQKSLEQQLSDQHARFYKPLHVGYYSLPDGTEPQIPESERKTFE